MIVASAPTRQDDKSELMFFIVRWSPFVFPAYMPTDVYSRMLFAMMPRLPSLRVYYFDVLCC